MVGYHKDDWEGVELYSDELLRKNLKRVQSQQTKLRILNLVKRLKDSVVYLIGCSMPDGTNWFICMRCHATMPPEDADGHECQ